MGETDERHDIISEKWVTLERNPEVVFVDKPGEPYREGLKSFGYLQREIHIRAQLAAAAPAMVRALLAAEYTVPGLYRPLCGACAFGRLMSDADPRHTPTCPVDQALTAAGFPDQASRDAARRHLLSGAQ
jgi:hypothetical protein